MYFMGLFLFILIYQAFQLIFIFLGGLLTLSGSLEQLRIGLGLDAVLFRASGGDEHDEIASAWFEIGERVGVVGGERGA